MTIPKYFYFRVHIKDLTSIELEDASDVDVVEVVRCKDCKHGLKVVAPITAIFCTRFGAKDMAVEDDDYCSYGERGEADEERKSTS